MTITEFECVMQQVRLGVKRGASIRYGRTLQQSESCTMYMPTYSGVKDMQVEDFQNLFMIVQPYFHINR